MSEAISENAFLGGKLTIRQPLKGYRAGVDPVLLAAFVAAKSGQRVLELGCGVGTAFLCLASRVPDLKISAVELQADYGEMAVQNAALNGIAADVHLGDLAQLPAPLRQQQFDHVIANPPYYDRSASTAATDSGRETALGEATPLAMWVAVAARRLAPNGYASFVHRAARLPDLLAALSEHLGSVEVMPLTPRVGRDAGLVLVRARKGGRAEFCLHAPVIMHQGATHDGDRESYTDQIRAVLRDGAALIDTK